MEWLSEIFDLTGVPPRWDCGSGWQAAPFWGWLHITSDLFTFVAYVAIPLAFIYFLRQRPDTPLPRIWWLFATFIFACGTVHLLEALIFWWPIYRLSGIIKFVTAVASWATLLALVPAIPVALTFRSPRAMEQEIQAATKRMQEHDEHLRLALSAGRMGTWSWNLLTNRVEFDAMQIELTGMGARTGWVEFEQFFERVHREDREALHRAIRTSIDDGIPYHHTFRLYVPEKGFRWIQGRGTVTRDASGRSWKMMGVNFDITDQMEDQDTLRVRTRALEHATSGIVITDARADDQPIVYVNPAFEELTGYSAADLLGKNCRLLQGAESDRTVIAQLRHAVRNQLECEVTILNYRKDGKPFWNNLKLSPVENDEGTVTHFVGIQTDISGRVRHEQSLVEAQAAAESANRAKSEFLANMSHEIRTPLTAILGCAESLCRELQEKGGRDTAKTIRSQGQLLLGILNDVLDLSKIEADKLEIINEPCSLLQIVADVRSLMNPQAIEKGLELETKFATRLPETIQTDPLRLRQVLLNLTSNAIKFTDEGRVEIRVAFGQHNHRPTVTLAVSDSGIGIPKDRRQAIFEAFTQVGQQISKKAGGTGLGLTICQRLVRMMGGEIQLDSNPGEGSTFTVLLPIEEESATSLYTPDDLAERRIQKESSESIDLMIPARILIAEDTRAIQFMLRRLLEPIVMEVIVVENGEEALQQVHSAAADKKPIDLVLMDMQMPVLDGYDATARLRQEGFDLPIIALTAGAMAGDRERCLAVGCTDYLSKPVSRGQLIGMVVNYCNNPGPGSPSFDDQRGDR